MIMDYWQIHRHLSPGGSVSTKMCMQDGYQIHGERVEDRIKRAYTFWQTLTHPDICHLSHFNSFVCPVLHYKSRVLWILFVRPSGIQFSEFLPYLWIKTRKPNTLDMIKCFVSKVDIHHSTSWLCWQTSPLWLSKDIMLLQLVTNETDLASRAISVQDVDSSQIKPSHQYMIWSVCNLKSTNAVGIGLHADQPFLQVFKKLPIFLSEPGFEMCKKVIGSFRTFIEVPRMWCKYNMQYH